MIESIVRLLLTFMLLSCSSLQTNNIKNTRNSFNFKDRFGLYNLEREVRNKNNQLILRRQLSPQMQRSLVLEKTIVVSQLGTIGKKRMPSMRPVIAQHTIWFEKQKYFTQLKVQPKTKTLEVVMKSPEKKWSGQKLIKFPKGKIFCFFSQIPECVKYHGLLTSNNKPKEFYIIWDNYPYHQETYENVGESVFQMVRFQYNGEENGLKIYSLSLGNQIIFYHFNYDKEFERMYWIAQGVSLAK